MPQQSKPAPQQPSKSTPQQSKPDPQQSSKSTPDDKAPETQDTGEQNPGPGGPEFDPSIIPDCGTPVEPPVDPPPSIDEGTS